MSDKKKELFLNQKQTLDTFLSTGAITQAQYDKSFGDLVRLMGMEEVVAELEAGAHAPEAGRATATPNALSPAPATGATPVAPAPASPLKRAYFAGGCFWCITPVFMAYGAEKVVCGYSGGDEPNPRYEDVKAQKTGHRETVCVIYDPAKLTYEKLLEIFLANVDPFDAEGQFIDKGFSYTLAIYYNDDTERKYAASAIKSLEERSAGGPAAGAACPASPGPSESRPTEPNPGALRPAASAALAVPHAAIALEPFKSFYAAEDYHQDYYLKNPEAFERELRESGRK